MSNWTSLGVMKHDDAVHGVTITSKQADRVLYVGKQIGLDGPNVLKLARLVTHRNDLRCVMDLTAEQAQLVIDAIGAIEC